MDEADIANDSIMADMERRLARLQAAADRPPKKHCDKCDEPITPARQKLRLDLCFDCAVLLERSARFFRKG